MTARASKPKQFLPRCAFLLLLAVAGLSWPAWAGLGNDWNAVAEGGAVVALTPDSAPPLSVPDTNTLRLDVNNLGHRAGLASGPSGDVNAQTGQWFDLSFYAATDNNKHFALTVSLESPDGKQIAARATLPEVGGPWAQFHLALNTHQTVAHCRLVVTLAETGTIRLNGITLVLREKP